MGYCFGLNIGLYVAPALSLLKKSPSRGRGTYADARGLHKLMPVAGVEPSTMSQLAAWVVQTDQVLTF